LAALTAFLELATACVPEARQGSIVGRVEVGRLCEHDWMVGAHLLPAFEAVANAGVFFDQGLVLREVDLRQLARVPIPDDRLPPFDGTRAQGHD